MTTTAPLRLRPELEIMPTGHDISGEAGLVIHDPLRHRFFWLPRRAENALSALRGLAVLADEEDVKELLPFLQQNRLLRAMPGDGKALLAEWQRGQHSIANTVLHNYISFRIPLVRPEPLLDATLDLVRPLASRFVIICILCLGLLGLWLTAKQWDAFSAMFWSSFTLAGAAGFAVTLAVLKVFHELGHAYVARHFKCRVPSMGVTFMMLTPMLYTDATHAWRLPSRWQRFAISGAGVVVELAIAAVALLVWALLPDGPARAMAFFVAATAWIASLAVNLSPFMRFDGYHMLADALGMHGVGPRSFALGNWWLREALFKPDAPPPEFLPMSTRRFLICFAFGTWIYRLTLFGGIAWLLYTSLPKVAGVPLALVEIHFFILKPVLRELAAWKTTHGLGLFKTRRAWFTFAFMAFLLLLALLPLDRHVHVPAVLLPDVEARVFAPEPAQVLSVQARAGDVVEKGQVLARLFVPEIGHLQRAAQLRLELSETRLTRIAADAKERSLKRVLEREREMAVAGLDGLAARGQLLALKAPAAGRLTGDSISLRVGQWVQGDDLLFQIVGGGRPRLVGLLPERDAGRVATESVLTFVAEDGVQAAQRGVLAGIDLPGSEGVAMPYLSSVHGGAVAVEQGGKASLQGYLPIVAHMEGNMPMQAQTGMAIIAAEPQSLALFLFRRLATVFLRESGF